MFKHEHFCEKILNILILVLIKISVAEISVKYKNFYSFKEFIVCLPKN